MGRPRSDLHTTPNGSAVKVPDVPDRGPIRNPDPVDGPNKPRAARPNYITLITNHRIMKKLVKRLAAATPLTGRILIALGAALGIGGLTATEFMGYQLTGEQTTDIAIIIAATLLTVLAGKAQVDEPTRVQIEREG